MSKLIEENAAKAEELAEALQEDMEKGLSAQKSEAVGETGSPPQRI